MPWKVFGSSGLLKQPKQGIAKGFIKRAELVVHPSPTVLGYGKTIVRVSNALKLLTHCSEVDGNNTFIPIYLSNGAPVHVHMVPSAPHHSSFVNESMLSQLPLQLNHYMFQSRQYYEEVKCSRGGGQSGHTSKYTMAYFDKNEHVTNRIVDTELKLRKSAKDNDKCRIQLNV